MTENLPRLGSALHVVGALIALAVLAGMHGFVFLSLGAEARETTGRTAGKQQFLDTAESVLSTHADLQRQLNEEEARLQELFERIPPTPRESDFLAQLAKLARQSGVTIQQFSRGEATEAETHSEMEVKLSAHASHTSICRFLAGLADLRRLCHVRELSISAPPDSSVAYPAGITLRIFFAPLRQTTASG